MSQAATRMPAWASGPIRTVLAGLLHRAGTWRTSWPVTDREYKEFQALLGELGRQIDDGLELRIARVEAPGIAERLAEIALALKRHPETQQELLDVYGVYHGHPQMHVQVPDELRPRHLTESYRLAWETLLLSPWSEQVAFMRSWSRVTQALASIGNPRSILVLEYSSHQTCTTARAV
jgi:hypothetical protein